MQQKSTGLKITLWIVRGLSLLIVFSVIGFLFWRIFSMRTPRELATLTPNSRLAAALDGNGGLTLRYQEQNTITRGKDNYGYFAVPHVNFIDEADQCQVVFRYNNSTLRALAEDYGLSEVPDRAEDLFDVTLIVVTDLTPDVKTDNDGNDPASVSMKRIKPTAGETLSLKKGLYNYRKFTFDSVHLDDDTLAVYVDVYYVGDIKYNEEDFDIYSEKAYGTLCIFDYGSEWLFRDLSGKEKNAIRDFAEP